MKTRKGPRSGALGDIVASRNRFGEHERTRVRPKSRATPARRRVWESLGEISGWWNRLAEEQRVGWRRLAKQVHSRPRLGESFPLDGQKVFNKLNTVLATCGRERLLDAPPLPGFGPNPVAGFAITEGRDGNVFKLRVRGAPVEDLMVFASPPCHAGREYNSNFGFLGLLPGPEGGESDITEQYLKKLKEWRKLKDKRYHVPLAGAKVFIRVWQQVNGWENRRGMFRSSAFVPAMVRAAGGRKGRGEGVEER